MLFKIRKHLLSFDFYRSAVLTLLIVLPISYGLRNGIYGQIFPYILGMLFGFFSNIEGTNKHRIIGMLVSISWSSFCLGICLFSSDFSNFIHLFTISVFIFVSSLIAVYGFRGSMISFSGLFAIVMSFVLQSANHFETVLHAFLGGLMYLLVASLSHLLYQNKHIQINLAECVNLTAKYLSIIEKLRWKPETDSPELQSELLKTQNTINDKHELLRTLLMSSKNTLISSNKNRRQYLLFIELVNIYENALAKNVNTDFLYDKLGNELEMTNPLQKASQLIIEDLRRFSKALQFNLPFEVSPQIEMELKSVEETIQNYITKVGPKQAREVSLTLRNLLDIEHGEYRKLVTMARINQNIFDTGQLTIQKSKMFLTPQDYSLKVLLENLNLESNIFRHSLRITTAVIIGYIIGKLMHAEQSNWLIVTIIIILRPNYGLTKSRAKNRILGTIWGAVLAYFIIAISSNHVFYGIIATLSLLFGFSFVQKDYRLSSALITISIILLYVINDHNGYETIIKRLEFTALGVLISYMAMYLLWPVWENYSMIEVLEKAISANKIYWEELIKIYRDKLPLDNQYKMARKAAFLTNGNLNGTFQRMSDEPISKRKNLSNLYAAVLLNQTFLSAVAALSSYIQGHHTTQMSENTEIIAKRISQNLDVTIANLKQEPIKVEVIHTKEAFAAIRKKYNALNEQRNEEILSGKMGMDPEMREMLQEAKVVIEQLKWLKSISDNMKNIGQTLQ